MKTKSTTLLLFLFGTAAFGSIENARIVSHRGLAATIQEVRSAGTWIAYELPSPASGYVMCCFDDMKHGRINSGNACRLGRGNSFFHRGEPSTPAIDTSAMIVALHTKRGAIEDIYVYSRGCHVNGAGATVHFVDGVSAGESLQLLEGLIPQRGKHGDVFAAMAMHDSPRVVRILERYAVNKGDSDLRGQAVFWLAQAGGRHGFEVARRLANDDPDREMRKKSVFALTQSADPEVFDTLASIVRTHGDVQTRSEAVFWLGQHGEQKALPILRQRIDAESNHEVREKAVFAIGQVEGGESTRILIDLARNHRDSGVRKQALFWLGQKAGEKLAGVIRQSAGDDPDSEVREAAVFAISQRPADEAVPALIELAEKHRDPNVRKQAVFWLSQMDDPRALAAIEKIVTR